MSVVAVTETELSEWQRPSLRVECFFLPLVCVQSDHTTAVLSQAGRQAGARSGEAAAAAAGNNEGSHVIRCFRFSLFYYPNSFFFFFFFFFFGTISVAFMYYFHTVAQTKQKGVRCSEWWMKCSDPSLQ